MRYKVASTSCISPSYMNLSIWIHVGTRYIDSEREYICGSSHRVAGYSSLSVTAHIPMFFVMFGEINEKREDFHTLWVSHKYFGNF